MKRTFSNDYTADWKAIAATVKERAGWRCIRCGHPAERPKPAPRVPCDERCDPRYHQPNDGKQRVLTVDHADGDKANNRWPNLLSLCQVCHLQVQGRVIMERPWVFEHTPWFRPYVAGAYAIKYLGLHLSRAEVEARLEELLDLERRAVLG